jgi:hypothetical protein
VGVNTTSIKKGHGVPFSASNVKDRADREPLYQKFPQDWGESAIVATTEVASEVRSRLINYSIYHEFDLTSSSR